MAISVGATNNLNEIIKNNTSQMRIFTDTIKYVVSNCKIIDKRSIDQTKNVLEYFKTVIFKMNDLAHYINNTFTGVILFDTLQNIINQCNRVDTRGMKVSKTVLKSVSEFLNDVNDVIKRAVKIFKNKAFDSTSVKNMSIRINNAKKALKNLIKLPETMLVIKSNLGSSVNYIFIIANVRLILLKSFLSNLINLFNAVEETLALGWQTLTTSASFTLIEYLFLKIENIFKSIKSISINPIIFLRLHFLKIFIKKIFNTISIISDMIDTKKVIGFVQKITPTLLLLYILNHFINKFLDFVNGLSGKGLNIIGYIGLRLYTSKLKKFIGLFVDLINDLRLKFLDLPKPAKIAKLMGDLMILLIIGKLINLVLYQIKNIAKSVLRQNIFLLLLKGGIRKMLKSVMNFAIDIINTVSDVLNKVGSKNMLRDVKNIFFLNLLFKGVLFLLKTVGSVGFFSMLFIRFNIKLLIKILESLKLLIRSISRFSSKQITSASIKLKSIFGILWTLNMLMLTLLLMIPVFVAFTLASPIILLCFWAFSYVIKFIMKIIDTKTIMGLLLLVVLIGLVTLIAFMLVKLYEMTNDKISDIISNTVLLILGILAIAVVLVAVGYLMAASLSILAPSLIGLLFLIIVIGIILLIAFMLGELQKINIDKEKIKKVVGDIMESLKVIIEAIFNGFADMGGSKEGEPWYADILNFMGGTVRVLLTSIMAIFPLALAVISIGLIQLLARQLKDIESINLDSELIKTSVASIIDCAMMVIGGVFQKDDKNRRQPKGFFDKLLRLALPDNMLDMMDALSAIGKLTLAWIAIGLVKNIAESLKTILDIKLDQNIIQEKTTSILTTAYNVVDTVFKNIEEGSNKKIKKIDKYLGCIYDVVEELVDITDELSEMSNLKQESLNNITLVTNTMISVLNDLSVKIKAGFWTVDKRTSQMSELYKVIKDFSSMTPEQIKNSEAISKNYIELLDKVGTTDIEKLKTTVNLFEKMADFSKTINGNFEGLADALNEKIAPLLEKIQNGMDGLKISVEQSSADVSSSVYAASQGTLSKEEMKKQVERENPQATEEDKNDITMKRIQQQITKQNDDLTSNMDELISLFKNGAARVTII